MTTVITQISEWKTLLRTSLKDKTIGFVPTMGALHDGHLTLLKKSLKENDITICSIFVNPTQFNNKEDLEKYPRTFENDLSLLSACGVDYLFYPEYKDLYPDNFTYKVIETDFSKKLCGEYRPGHFDGVLTVVMKLINITSPTRVYFGEKDYQQFSLINKMAQAFFMDVDIVPVQTVRESSGLAMSSRNVRLTKNGLDKAATFAKLLSSSLNLEEIRKNLEDQDIEVEYLQNHHGRRFGAVWIDGVRLIDNV